jgi:drug/metabolite transporter (DMT)-like permease
MQSFLTYLPAVFVWGAFFLTTVLGHVALKKGAGASSAYNVKASVEALVSPWGIVALVSWGLSCWLWALILTRHSFFEANTVSAMRYVLLCLAGWVFLGETWGIRELAAMTLVVAGVIMLGRS